MVSIYKRNCPKCNIEIEYTNKKSRYNAEQNGSQCKKCQSKENGDYFRGRSNPNYPKNRRNKLEKSKFFRNCPDCNKVIYYGKKWALREAIRKQTICDSCAAYKYEKTWNNVIEDSHIKKMRATKSGFTSWEEYKQKYPKKKSYINEVHRLTRKQPLYKLENYDKLQENTGIMGTEGAYQIDHIKSIDACWKDGTPAKDCAHISNLQVIRWEQNIIKGR